MRIRTMGVDVEVAVEGSASGYAVPAFENQWCWARPTRCNFDGITHLRVVVDEDPEVCRRASAQGDVAATTVAEASHHLSIAVTSAAIAAQRGKLSMFHAACLADPASGEAIALIAPSRTGKTTATAVLGRRLSYLSDETAAVDAAGRIWSHPKPLSILLRGSAVKVQRSPAEAQLLAPVESARLTAIALLRRDGESSVRVRRLSTGEALVRLAENTSYVAAFDQPLATLAAQIERVGGVVELRYREAGDLVPVVDGLLGAA